ncbi:MAG TPA: hypothetical protein VL326_22210 [Kofleriaceae bacterium]|nr:hypothetical protein [Kofleriaceae bacterium]
MRAYWKAGFLAAASLVACTGDDPQPSTPTQQTHQTIVAGAGYTTFDAALGGCLNGGNPNGINCNAYSAKDKVYMSGGPNTNNHGLTDGWYFFAVLTPGSQLDGFLDGNLGNLSDVTAGGTTGDSGSGDDVSNRTFRVASNELVEYTGTHAVGTTPNGRTAIGLAPFDDTDNPGGVYILAICASGATDPSQCKYDAFRIRHDDPTQPPPQFPLVDGGKYYDANLNGQYDAGETWIPGWQIDFHDEVSGTVTTGEDGKFTLELIPDHYTFAEEHATNTTTMQNGSVVPAWFQTGNTVDQTSSEGGAYVVLNSDKTYYLEVDDNQKVHGLYFGNICIGKGGGLTIGFWSNKNGQALIDAADLAALVALNLRSANGSNFDPASKSAYRTWLLNATATNMAYMLSAQLSASVLNVRNGFVSTMATIYAPGTNSADALGFARLADVQAEANTELGLHGYVVAAGPIRTYQEALKNALDNSNNDKNFVQATPATCPTATF